MKTAACTSFLLLGLGALASAQQKQQSGLMAAVAQLPTCAVRSYGFVAYGITLTLLVGHMSHRSRIHVSVRDYRCAVHLHESRAERKRGSMCLEILHPEARSQYGPLDTNVVCLNTY